MITWMRFVNQHLNRLTLMAGILIVASYLILLGQYIGMDLSLVNAPLFKDSFLILAALIAMLPIGLRAIQSIRFKTIGIDVLVTVAVIGAFFIREYSEAAIVTFLFLFGSYLEGKTLARTRSSIKELTDLAPQEAVRLTENGKEEVVPVDAIEKGDILLIRSGGKIPVDGRVISGEASINEASITGESVPVNKKEGTSVYSGTIVDTGFIEMEAEKVGNDTTFAKIIELVEEAQDTKSKAEDFLDRFAKYYTPFIMVLAVIAYFMTQNLHLAITFLVVACPGALIIGAPVSNVTGIGNGAKNGVLIKGGNVMEALSKVDTLVFDKTGTLTKGQPEVTDIKLFTTEKASLNEEDFLTQLALAETISEHHLGVTIVNEAKNRNLALDQYTLKESEVLKGQGISAMIARQDGEEQETSILAGNRQLMATHEVVIASEIEAHALTQEKQGNTAIFVAFNGSLVGVISIADQIRDDAKEALKTMRAQGVKKIIMLTGDNRHTAEAVSNALGIDEFYAELLPHEKVEHVKRLQQEGAVVAMAGDGINDAPAIATADVGLAMGEGGTDVSMETADLVLMADRLSQYSHAYALAKATMKNLFQNITLALFVVGILLVGVVKGDIHLASGMLIHQGSVLAVIFNGMRLMKFTPKSSPKLLT